MCSSDLERAREREILASNNGMNTCTVEGVNKWMLCVCGCMNVVVHVCLRACVCLIACLVVVCLAVTSWVVRAPLKVSILWSQRRTTCWEQILMCG